MANARLRLLHKPNSYPTPAESTLLQSFPKADPASAIALAEAMTN
jgi:hypothetical protein